MESKNELKEIDIKYRACCYFDDRTNDTDVILVIFYLTKNYMKYFSS